jgi:isoquinoline 1-oxidoreductase beta subunit
MRGLVGVVEGKRWLAAAATDWWTAERALDAMAPRFTLAGPVTSERIDELLDRGVRRGEPQRIACAGRRRGDGQAEPRAALRRDAAAHGTIETASCTARLADGRLELWLCEPGTRAARARRRESARHGARPTWCSTRFPPAGASTGGSSTTMRSRRR